MKNETVYISTYLGNRFYPRERLIERIDIEDIAHGLAFQCRFNGQTSAFYSVAQHSLIVADLVCESQRKAALLHDASEAYLGDMVKPLKVLLSDFAAIEEEVTHLIAKQFIVNFDHAEIKRADLIALATEKRDFMPHSTEPWSYLRDVQPLVNTIVPMSPLEAKEAFLRAWDKVNHCQTHSTYPQTNVVTPYP